MKTKTMAQHSATTVENKMKLMCTRVLIKFGRVHRSFYTHSYAKYLVSSDFQKTSI